MVIGVLLFIQSLQIKPEAPADFHIYFLNVCDHRNQFKGVKLWWGGGTSHISSWVQRREK